MEAKRIHTKLMHFHLKHVNGAFSLIPQSLCESTPSGTDRYSPDGQQGARGVSQEGVRPDHAARAGTARDHYRRPKWFVVSRRA